ncbi:MAG: hypothetical protein ACM3SV_05700 [Betaproteobacteria bacterium]
MTARRPMLWRMLAAMLAVSAFFLASPANAGSVYFGMSREGDRLVLINHGNSSAFHPAVLRLLGDGRWEQLPVAPGVRPPVELVPAGRVEFQWTPTSALGQFEAATPLMVRFFDQAGSGFGQLSFFNQPPPAPEPLQASYVDGLLTVTPPSGLKPGETRVSWLLWPQEDGIAPLRSAVRFEHAQPPAKRIEWRAGMGKLQFDLGAGQPAAMLVNETDHGLELQQLPGGGLQGRQQRAGWLQASIPLYWSALAALIAAALTLGIHWLRSRQKARA